MTDGNTESVGERTDLIKKGRSINNEVAKS